MMKRKRLVCEIFANLENGAHKNVREWCRFFVNLGMEAPAAKPVHFAKLPTAFVTQKNSLLPRQPAEGNFSVPYLGYVLSASWMTIEPWTRFRLCSSRYCPFSRRTVPDTCWKCEGLGA